MHMSTIDQICIIRYKKCMLLNYHLLPLPAPACFSASNFFILLRSDCFSLFVLSSFSMAPRRCLFKYSMSTCNEKIHQKLFNTPLQSTSMTQVKELTLLSFFGQLPNIILFHILVIITHGLKHKGENSEKGMKY